MQYLVSKALLELLDKYDGDFGLLDERWASKEDRNAFSPVQIRTLSAYIDQIKFSKVDCLSPELRIRADNQIRELAEKIDPEVITILKQRHLSS